MLIEGHRLAATAPCGWITDYIIAFLCFGIIFIVAFVAWQGLSPNPLMPLHVWEDKNFSLVSLSIVALRRFPVDTAVPADGDHILRLCSFQQ